jgi:hypothetical protein
MPLWYIDALDARAGMGLATYRDADWVNPLYLSAHRSFRANQLRAAL